jgi:hypothetical protein
MEFRYVAKSAGQTIWARQTIAAARAMIEEEEVAAMFAELRTLAERHAHLYADRARLEAQIAAAAEQAAC